MYFLVKILRGIIFLSRFWFYYITYYIIKIIVVTLITYTTRIFNWGRFSISHIVCRVWHSNLQTWRKIGLFGTICHACAQHHSHYYQAILAAIPHNRMSKHNTRVPCSRCLSGSSSNVRQNVYTENQLGWAYHGTYSQVFSQQPPIRATMQFLRVI